jgi:excisionase family DNA binding protein
MARKTVENAITPEAATPAKVTPSKSSVATAARAKKVSSKAAAEATPVVKKTRQRIRPETRAQMLERLMNPEVSLHEASVILGVCRATVRRYADMGTLTHERTEGRQRRFHLRDVLALSRTREAEKRKRR